MNPQLAAQIKAESDQIEQDWPGTNPAMQEMQEFWKEHRPNLWASLQEFEMTEAYPRVMLQRVLKREKELREQNQPDAGSRARAEVLGSLMTPEEEDSENPMETLPAER